MPDHANTRDQDAVMESLMSAYPGMPFSLAVPKMIDALHYLVANMPRVKPRGKEGGKGRCSDPECCPPADQTSTPAELDTSMRVAPAREMLDVSVPGGPPEFLPGQLVPAERFATAASIMRNDGAIHVVDDIEPIIRHGDPGHGLEWSTCNLITVHGQQIIRIKGGIEDEHPDGARQLAAELLSAAARADSPPPLAPKEPTAETYLDTQQRMRGDTT